MTVFRCVVPRDTFPKKVVSSRWLRNFEAIDLDVSEWVDFLFTFKKPLNDEVDRHTLLWAIRFSSRMTVWTVAVFPVPGTPEISRCVRHHHS